MNDREKWREIFSDIRAGGTTWWWITHSFEAINIERDNIDFLSVKKHMKLYQRGLYISSLVL